ncbi:hypothetical protein BGY98DRAFT_973459 [Russula aff. rugulosa BPL654]|nr:hypothetical protein BGY98DRAFT_973459 [Russula aff. rugulosa BPL654]
MEQHSSDFFGNLNSAVFVVDVQHDAQGRPTQVTFNSGSWGRGVGMSRCQLGAIGRAAACPFIVHRAA